jgi:hypothetical protein
VKTHIWNCTEIFPRKVNFIDDNNVLVGYDLEQDCCEDAFWTISEARDGSNPLHKGSEQASEEISLEGYAFDPSFHEFEYNPREDSNSAIFKLLHSPDYGTVKKADLYLRLENQHNGYYGHGFTFKGSEVIQGTL